MSHQCLIAEFKSMEDANVAIKVLETDDFTDRNVSIVSRRNDQSVQELDDLKAHRTDSPSTAGAVGVGAMSGGALATPIATATLIGPFMVAGPLAGMAAGAALGSLLSSTERWGVDHDIAADYEIRVQQGSVLIIVNDEDSIRIDDAEALLKTTTNRGIHRFSVA